MLTQTFDELLGLFEFSQIEQVALEKTIDSLVEEADNCVSNLIRSNLKKRQHRTPSDEKVSSLLEKYIESGSVDILLREAVRVYIKSFQKDQHWDFDELSKAFRLLENIFRLLAIDVKAGRPRKSWPKLERKVGGFLQTAFMGSDANLKRTREKRKREAKSLDEQMIEYLEALHLDSVAKKLEEEGSAVPFHDIATWLNYKKKWGFSRYPTGSIKKVRHEYGIQSSDAALRKRLSRARQRYQL